MITWKNTNTGKMVAINTSIEYIISKASTSVYSDVFLVRGGIDVIGTYDTQLEAMKAFNEYEKKLKSL